MLKYNIRNAKDNDLVGLVQLCGEHAAFEENDYVSSNSKQENLKQLLFSSPPRIQCLVVEDNHGLVGFATYMLQLSTWDAANYMYLDCLFLRPEARGQGIGKKLMQRIAVRAKEENCINVQWQTPVFNTNAINFYNHLGAESKDKLRFFLNRSAMLSLI